MLIRSAPDLRDCDVTDQSLYLQRRSLIAAAGALGAGLALGAGGAASAAPLAVTRKMVTTTEKLTPEEDVTTYNNYYEFGTDKDQPARTSGNFKPRPWTVRIDGACAKPGVYDLDALIKRFPLEERIYRMRCVEAWSMVIPWVGFPLAALLRMVEPTAAAKYVSFETIQRPAEMPGLRSRVLDWPYREGLRMDEAMNPLTLMAVGLYGQTLPNQNGAPIRLVTPWKYGFKGIKSIHHIQLVERQPYATWNDMAPREYGFYANVNPEVDHPRWSQASERRIGEFARRKTLPFNGYGEQVASMYAGMDLRRNF